MHGGVWRRQLSRMRNGVAARIGAGEIPIRKRDRYLMKIIVKTVTIWAAGLLICGCVTSPDTNRSPPAVMRTNTATMAHTIFQKIEQQLPELSLAGPTNAISPSAGIWKGGEDASAAFFLWRNPRYPPVEFPPARRTPFLDLQVTIARYPSSNDAQHALESSLFQRPAMTPPKENYRGASLYRYTSGGGTTICHSGRYVIEVNPYSEGATPLTMKALDIVLGELDRAP